MRNIILALLVMVCLTGCTVNNYYCNELPQQQAVTNESGNSGEGEFIYSVRELSEQLAIHQMALDSKTQRMVNEMYQQLLIQPIPDGTEFHLTDDVYRTIFVSKANAGMYLLEMYQWHKLGEFPTYVTFVVYMHGAEPAVAVFEDWMYWDEVSEKYVTPPPEQTPMKGQHWIQVIQGLAEDIIAIDGGNIQRLVKAVLGKKAAFLVKKCYKNGLLF